VKRKPAIALIVVVAVLLAGALALRWAMDPRTLGPRVLALAGEALGLEISAEEFDYRLLGGPRLVARGVSARLPGAPAPTMEADRVMVAVPWSTLRARGADPVITRIELDAPRVELEPFMGWWSRRPRGDGPLPTLREGLRVDRGRIDAGEWSIQDVAIDLPRFAPDERLGGRVRGRYQAAAIQVPFDLQVAMTRPSADAGLGAAGTVTPRADGWRLPSRLVLSTRLDADTDAGMRLRRLRLSSASRYVADGTTQAFALGLAGEGLLAGGVLGLEPAAVVVRGRGMIPRLRGRGRLALGQPLEFQLAGEIERWPDAWPALPPPVGTSDAPLPFELGYAGAASLADPVELRLARERATFDGRLRVAEVAAWIGAAGRSPLPPLDGRVTVPLMEVAGASLHGVDITFEDEAANEGGKQ